MDETGVVLTPGVDFDKKNGNKTVRLSFSSKQDIVFEGVEIDFIIGLKKIIDSTNPVFSQLFYYCPLVKP